jgi:riboflavin biosynthesis pyrimidine reductase
VRSLWPATSGELTDDDLERLYAYPDRLPRPWLQVNFVSSADGASTVDGTSAGLSSAPDRRIFLLGRDLADVVLVGGGTVRAENLRGVRAKGEHAHRRARHGLAPVPPIAVVTGTAAIDPGSRLFTDTTVPPIILTTDSADLGRRRALADAGADVIVTGDQRVDLGAAMDVLAERGLHRVDCEGGPHLFGELLALDLVDQLCLTVAPLLAGAGAGRIAEGRPSGVPQSLELASVLHDGGFLMLRYRRRPR